MEMNVNDMSCKELVELVTDYLEGALSPADEHRFDLHIAKCDWCKIYIEQIRLTIKAAGKLSEESIPPHVQDDLIAVFRGWKKG
jgi:anti-sigma factor RsiW